MEGLPEEILLHVIAFLDASDLLSLHLVSKHFLKLARDNELWKSLVIDSSYSAAARRRRDFLSGAPTLVPDPQVLQLRAAARSAATNASVNSHVPVTSDGERALSSSQPRETQNTPAEDVDFYHEYIARHSPLALSWLQNPAKARSQYHHEIRGLGLVGELGDSIVAPLDDDSVCLWDLGCENDTWDESNGRIKARSKPGILSAEGPQESSRATGSGKHDATWREAVVESVSVDRPRKRAYFAVQGGLNEIDLGTLKLVSHQKYPTSICALSEISHSSPLTVATAASLYIHDHRLSKNVSTSAFETDQLDSLRTSTRSNSPTFSSSSTLTSSKDLHRALLTVPPASHAPLFDSPLSIVHLHSNQTIHVAGRFPSILTYDRRSFPKVHSTIHSGARLSSLTSRSSSSTNTLIACGEYNGKGSLELYQISATGGHSAHVSSYQNRTTAARSKLLSVASHGNRIVFCDGDGMLKWVEQDGSTPVRRWNINSSSKQQRPRGLFGGPSEAGEGDVARKIVPLNEGSRSELAIWTGEKIGVVNFRKKPRFGPWVEKEEDEESKSKEETEVFEGRMRRALERQADEVRFLRGLGLSV